ncbi:hypothetical protein Leryth_016608 [Lithospermum erythrorhizon]|uniref:SNARE protein n=1 Tax=Lithospermum erythrorhizon TaxID=34254 RepID=A0AAV3PW20_LITER|nr:hypothetical protein Leryth_016608 [Lithospermum erythrorhizon]
MNDLMTKSFLSYVEMKKQAQRDVETERELEKGELSHAEEDNLSRFFIEVEAIQNDMQEITELLIDLQTLNEEAKLTHSPKILRGLRDQLDSDMVSVLRKSNVLKARVEALDSSNTLNRLISVAFALGTAVDRTRIATTHGLRVKLKDLMNDFQALREMILSDYKDSLRRRYFNVTGNKASEDLIEKIVSGTEKVEIFEEGVELNLEHKERHEAVMDLRRSLNKLHQVFLDMAVIVDTQGETIDDIEHNVAVAGSYIAGGTNSLFYAKQMKKGGKTWLYWVLAVLVIILVVCFIAMLST